jgi:hypothetical protein
VRCSKFGQLLLEWRWDSSTNFKTFLVRIITFFRKLLISGEIKVGSYFNIAASSVHGSESSILFNVKTVRYILDDFGR